MHSFLKDIERRPPGDAISRLRELARLGLCATNHEYQVDKTAARFRDRVSVVIKDFKITELRMQLERERRERMRLERLFVGEDEGYVDGDDETNDNGALSMGEISDQAFREILESAEQPNPDYHSSIPGSEEECGSLQEDFSEKPHQLSEAPANDLTEKDREHRTRAFEETISGLQVNFRDASRRLSRGQASMSRSSSVYSARGSRHLTGLQTRLTNELYQAKQHRDEIRSQYDLLQQDIVSEQQRGDVLEQDISTTKSSHSGLLGRVSIIHDAVADGMEQTDKLDSKIEEVKRNQSDISTEIEGLRLEVVAGQERQDELEIEYTEAEAEINGSIASCRMEIEQLRRKLDRNERLGIDQSETIDKLTERVARLEKNEPTVQDSLQIVQQLGEVRTVNASSQTKEAYSCTNAAGASSIRVGQQPSRLKTTLSRNLKRMVKSRQSSGEKS